MNNKTSTPNGLTPQQLIIAAAVIAALLAGLWSIKHYLTFSLTNFTLFLLLPIGPLLIGFVLTWVLVSKKREALDTRWLVFFISVSVVVFALDQYFAYLHDGTGEGFLSWYSNLVSNRSLTLAVRGHTSGSAERVGGYGYVLELVKLGGILWTGLAIYRDDRKLVRSSSHT